MGQDFQWLDNILTTRNKIPTTRDVKLLLQDVSIMSDEIDEVMLKGQVQG